MTTKRLRMPDLKDYMTTEEAAAALGFHIDHIRRMLREGDLVGIKVGITWLVSKESVKQYKEATSGKNKYDPTRGND
jgi:excisionase family DNA binding protein